MDPNWLLLLLPVAFAHGWYLGREHGVKIGAAGMFDQLYDTGIPVKGKTGVRSIQVSYDEQ